MYTNNLVSIIMPAYNVEKYIKYSIESVINQTYNNWELIIVDDCSKDKTIDVINSFKDKRIKLIKNEKNEGAITSRNKALQSAKGEWIAFLDSDDIWYKDKLEKQLSFMLANNYSFSYTEYERIDDNGNNLNVLCSGPKKVSKRIMYNYDYLGCLTVMYNQKVVGLIQIDKRLDINNDYAIWLKAVKKSNCYLLQECLAKYRVRKGSLSNRNIVRTIKSFYILYRISEERSVLISIVLTIRNTLFGLFKKFVYEKSL